jgi:transposase
MKEIKHSTYQTEVGIDVSKETLRVHIDGKQKDWSNTPVSVAKLIDECFKNNGNFRITCESTGSYDAILICLCLEKGAPVSQVNPTHVKNFIRSFGRHAKTDTIDACLIARFARERDPALLGKAWLANHHLKEIQRRIRALTKIRSSHLASIDKYRDKSVVREIRSLITVIDSRIAKHTATLDALIAADEHLAARRKIIEAVVGVGPKTCRSLLIDLPELGSLSRGSIAGLVGLAPQHDDSGTHNGSRRIRAGRKEPRSALYMAALSAARYNPNIKPVYERLREAGKPAKVAIVAIARKLLIHLNTQLKPIT